jgi:transcriptional regulator with XRE-family HTH domain
MRIEDVARLCGVHRRPIEYLVRGHLFRNPREETCEKIAKGLGVSVATVKMALKESVRRRIEWENRVPGVDPGPLP